MALCILINSFIYVHNTAMHHLSSFNDKYKRIFLIPGCTGSIVLMCHTEISPPDRIRTASIPLEESGMRGCHFIIMIMSPLA